MQQGDQKLGKSFYVTTPIYYVNDVPHIGHAYTTIASDVMARYKKLCGRDVYFLTGTDEHGQKIERTAKEAGKEPLQLADEVVVRFQELWKVLNISNDDFIRTTEERHKKAVTQIFKTIEAKGDIYLGEYEGWYDVRNEAYITETQYEEYLQMPELKRPVIEKVKEESYFFRLSRYTEPLLEFYANNPDFIKPEYRKNEVVKFVESGLKDLSISRTSFSWGIPVYHNSRHVIYVWFDALTNYMTAVGYPDDDEMFTKYWPADIHFVGKDILRFHAVFWPAFLMSAGLPVPKTVFAHGWWTIEGEKMSKSLGNVIDPYKIAEEFGVDVFRYFLLREIPFGQDGDFSRESIKGRVNGELANGLGNLASRSLGMIEKYCSAKVPSPSTINPEDDDIRRHALKALENYNSHMEEIAYSKALVDIWDFIGFTNKYIDDMAPWALYKNGETDRLDTVLWTISESLRLISIVIYPFIPASSELLWSKLGMKSGLSSQVLPDAGKWGLITPGNNVSKGDNLFNRI